MTDDGKVRFTEPKKCAECKADFNPSKSVQKYCGYKCSNTVANRSRKKVVMVTCLNCKAKFAKRPSDIKQYKQSAKNRYRYCTKDCFVNSQQKSMTVSRLKIRAWTEFSKYIRERDRWVCFTCGKVGTGAQMHAGHFISRRYNSTLFDERNVHAQCAGCNMFRNGEPHLYAAKIIKVYGIDVFNDLLKQGKQPKKFTKQELIDLYRYYKQLNSLIDTKSDLC